MTRIRLLLPTATIDKAQAVRQAHSVIRHELDPTMTPDRFDELRRDTAAARAALIDSAKNVDVPPEVTQS